MAFVQRDLGPLSCKRYRRTSNDIGQIAKYIAQLEMISVTYCFLADILTKLPISLESSGQFNFLAWLLGNVIIHGKGVFYWKLTGYD